MGIDRRVRAPEPPAPAATAPETVDDSTKCADALALAALGPQKVYKLGNYLGATLIMLNEFYKGNAVSEEVAGLFAQRLMTQAQMQADLQNSFVKWCSAHPTETALRGTQWAYQVAHSVLTGRTMPTVLWRLPQDAGPRAPVLDASNPCSIMPDMVTGKIKNKMTSRDVSQLIDDRLLDLEMIYRSKHDGDFGKFTSEEHAIFLLKVMELCVQNQQMSLRVATATAYEGKSQPDEPSPYEAQ